MNVLNNFELVKLVVQCLKHTNTLIFLKLKKKHDFPAFMLFSHTNVQMSEGTFCRVEVHIKVGCKGVFITRNCFRDVDAFLEPACCIQ